jgi:hypothetical protein
LARTTRSRLARLALAALGSAALLVTTPGLASADRKDRDDHKHYRHHKHHKDHDRHGGRHYGGSYQHGYRHAPRVYFHGDSCDDHGHGGYYGYRAARYHCGPCSHYFGSYDALHVHVHHAHHVPLFRLPHVIVQTSFGFGFPGW